MSRGYDPKERMKFSGGSPDERRKQALAAQLEMRKKAQEAQEAAKERAAEQQIEQEAEVTEPKFNIESMKSAIETIPLSLAGQGTKFRTSEVYKKLCETTLNVINDNSRRAILCWPNCDPSPAAVTALLSIADCAAATPIEIEQNKTLTEPKGLRALIYPYAKTAHTALRHIYVDKNYLGELQLKHQVRGTVTKESEALNDYHKTLARVRKLTGLALDGNDYQEFKNPCLDETLPAGGCEDKKAKNELLSRVGKETDLSEISRTGAADDPKQAKFYLFGLRQNEGLKPLKNVPAPVDVVFLDLDKTGRNRLGKDWLKRVQEFLKEVQLRFGEIAIVALTDDPWTYDKLRFECLAPPAPKKGKRKPSASNVVFAQKPDILESQKPATVEYSTVKKFDVITYGGGVAYLMEKLKSARNKASDSGDIGDAEKLQSVINIISRCGSLPGSQIELSQFFESEIGSNLAAEMMTSYRVGSIVAELRESQSGWAQLNRNELNNLCKEVEEIWSKTEKLTPMAPLLREIVEGNYLKSSAKAAIVFPNDMLADFASSVLCSDPEIGEKVKERLENGMLQLLDQAGLNDLAELPTTKRNTIKTVVFIAPARSSVMKFLARPWLPDTVITLSDNDTIQSAARDVQRISTYPELSHLKQRMERFVQSATQSIQRVNNSTLNLDLNLEPVEDMSYPTGAVVNLAGSAKGNQKILKFEFEGQQVLLAKSGTKLVVQDLSHAIPLFSEVEAKQVEVGDRVCVIGDAFIEMARPLLNITARAAEEIRDYHTEVRKRFQQIEGRFISDKLEVLVNKMNLNDVTPERARYWVTLDDQFNVPIHDVIPHAPQDWATFKTFMNVLGVSDSIALKYWTWAVLTQRSHRLTSAMHFHDAYRSILVDSYGAQSSNPERAREVNKLRAAAESFVSAVTKKSEEKI